MTSGLIGGNSYRCFRKYVVPGWPTLIVRIPASVFSVLTPLELEPELTLLTIEIHNSALGHLHMFAVISRALILENDNGSQ
jgi:hypothetical protein